MKSQKAANFLSNFKFEEVALITRRILYWILKLQAGNISNLSKIFSGCLHKMIPKYFGYDILILK